MKGRCAAAAPPAALLLATALLAAASACGIATAQDSFAGAPFSADGDGAAEGPGAASTAPAPAANVARSTPPASGDAPAAGFQPGFRPGSEGPGAGGAGGPDFARVEAVETRDFGVPASDALHAGPMHGPTPAALPGGRTVTTRELHGLLSSGQPVLVFDVLGGAQGLPNAIPAAPASQPGRFDDALQRDLGAWLGQVTGGGGDVPMVFYCQSVECWMSWNAALRAVHLGYRNVLWYRGGIEAWQAAGLPLMPLGGR